MNKNIRDAWIAALQSGEYKKGNYQLRDLQERYDATGVLCELAIAAGVDVPVQKCDDPDGMVFGYLYGVKGSDHNRSNGLPKAVCEWAGIEYRTAYSIALAGDENKGWDKAIERIEKL